MPVNREVGVDSTRAGRATRAALVRAAWELTDEMSLYELLSAVRAEDVAVDVGVTTGAFFHHFPSRQHFVDAMVEDLLQEAHDQASRLELESLELIDAGQQRADLREEARSFLSLVEGEDVERRMRRMLLLWSRTGDEMVGGVRLTELVRRHYWDPVESAQREVWRLALDLAERYPIAPFDVGAITLVMEALGTGFLVRRLAMPELFTIDLFADSVLLLMSAMTTPIAGSVTLAELEVGLGQVTAAPGWEQGMRDREVAAPYASLLDDGWESRTFGDLVAAVPGGPTATELAATFGTVRRLAAYAFYTALEPVDWFDDREFERDPPPRRDAIAAIVLAARAHPSLARAHSLERVRDTARFGLTHSEGDVRSGVTLDSGILRAHLGTREGQSATVRQIVEVVTAVVDAALLMGVRPELDVEFAIQAATDMLPTGAT